jgi:hypothetical protein
MRLGPDPILFCGSYGRGQNLPFRSFFSLRFALSLCSPTYSLSLFLRYDVCDPPLAAAVVARRDERGILSLKLVLPVAQLVCTLGLFFVARLSNGVLEDEEEEESDETAIPYRAASPRPHSLVSRRHWSRACSAPPQAVPSASPAKPAETSRTFRSLQSPGLKAPLLNTHPPSPDSPAFERTASLTSFHSGSESESDWGDCPPCSEVCARVFCALNRTVRERLCLPRLSQ